MTQPPPRLYGITSRELMPGSLMTTKVRAAVVGGCGWIQYRDKSDNHRRRTQEATALRDLCHEYGAKLIINDDLDLAESIGADGIHLGQGDADAASARARLGTDAIIGVTCHASVALALTARDAGASYVAFGRFFDSATKPGASTAPLDVLTRAREQLDIPIVAIGGISLASAAAILAAGADTLAVCAAVFDCADPEPRARAFVEIAQPPRIEQPAACFSNLK